MLLMNGLHRYPEGNGEGNGGTTGTTGGTTQTTANDDAARAADFKSQLARNQGDLTRYAEKLHERNYHMRQRAQAAEALVPKEGSVVLSAEDGAMWKEYKGMGTVKEIGDRGSKLIQLEKYQMVSDAAAVAGVNPKVLSKLLPDGATLEIGEASDDDGKAMRVVNVVEGNDKTGLNVYAEKNWNDFLPALKAAGEVETGQTWIQQQGSTSGDAGNGRNPLLQAKLDQVKKRSEPVTSSD